MNDHKSGQESQNVLRLIGCAEALESSELVSPYIYIFAKERRSPAWVSWATRQRPGRPLWFWRWEAGGAPLRVMSLQVFSGLVFALCFIAFSFMTVLLHHSVCAFQKYKWVSRLRRPTDS